MPKASPPQASYRADVAEILADKLKKIPGMRRRGVLGQRPGFYAGDKLFAFLQREGVVLKLPEATVEQWVGRPGYRRYHMQGKPPMREWMEIVHAEAGDYASDLPLFREAAEFVAAPKPKKKAPKRKA
jgi:hypothetical protein